MFYYHPVLADRQATANIIQTVRYAVYNPRDFARHSKVDKAISHLLFVASRFQAWLTLLQTEPVENSREFARNSKVDKTIAIHAW